MLAPRDRECDVVRHTDLGAGYWEVAVSWPELARAARPGEFAMIRPGRSVEPLLRRPFSLADADAGAGTVSFLGKSIGPGTRALGRLRPGDRLPIVAPLGRGFRWDDDPGRVHLMLAGGIGVAPFPLLARRLAEAGERAVLLYGGRGREDLVQLDLFEAAGVEVRCIAEDGTGPRRGLVTRLLEEFLEEECDPSVLRAYSCGPHPMLRAVGGILARAEVSHQTALEEYMACGFGVCLGCVVPARGPGGEIRYERCCREGPVFDWARLAL